MSFYDQSGYDVRFEWGEHGVETLAPLSNVVVIVDVLSFSTCVDVALSRRATVFPFGWKDEKASSYADENGAMLAVRRGQEGYSLSPPSLATLPENKRIVLPSPNGSALTVAASSHAKTFAGCLRHRNAVANAVDRVGGTIDVIACGERWLPQNTLRPAIEDQIGAGAIIASLSGSKSPEARTAEAAFEQARSNLQETLMQCASGRELVEKGYPDDVAYASELDVSTTVPCLDGSAYVNTADSR